jgi:spermidine synthase
MRVIARFAGPNGEIRIIEERATGARTYCEGGVSQSRVLAGGRSGLDYITLMEQLLIGRGNVLLLGCGGGVLASMLHRQGRRVTIVDVNPMSFQLARTFFWMPHGLECITRDMRDFVQAETRSFESIGIDVGGPRFSYEKVLPPAVVAQVRRLLRPGGRIAINISCEEPTDPMPERIADLFAAAGLNVWVFKENHESEVNAIILASARREAESKLAAIAKEQWLLARLAPRQAPRFR